MPKLFSTLTTCGIFPPLSITIETVILPIAKADAFADKSCRQVSISRSGVNCLQGTFLADKRMGVCTNRLDLVLAGVTEVSLGLPWGREMG